MSNKHYLLSNLAILDLQEIWLYTFERWSKEEADRYYNQIIVEIEYVSKNLNYGKTIEHVKKGYRVVKVKSHLIFYRISNNAMIEVIRILHESMDIPERLKD
ncbi:MAG: type II toxin-antitoxin system RelE/ParE family toxin [Ferruginibacter sp.]